MLVTGVAKVDAIYSNHKAEQDTLTNTLEVQNGIHDSYLTFCQHIPEVGLEAVTARFVASIQSQGYTVTDHLREVIASYLDTCPS
jgi:hypothetical protein